MKAHIPNRLLSVLFSVAMALTLVGCPSSKSTTTVVPKATTTISGKVTLSSTVGGTSSLKARPKAMMSPMLATTQGKPFGKTMKGSPSSPGNRLGKVIQRAISQAPSAIANATVSLYDADHPEWLYPVAKVTTGSDGSFTLSTKNTNPSTGAADTSGAAIPTGSYTMIAVGFDCSTSAVTTTAYPYIDPTGVTCTGDAYNLIVGIQAVVNKYEGVVTGNDLTVQSSDAVPTVASIMGRKASDLTTNTAGDYDLGTIANNQAIQIIFSMSMNRVKTPSAITLKDSSGTSIAGTWKMNPDLTVATFYPTSGAVLEGSKYKIAINNTKTANYYGKGLKTAVNAVYTAGDIDNISPNAILISPDAQIVDITTSIKIAANEAMDVNTITFTSTPSMGDKPTIKSLGYKNVAGSQYDYGYQIIPSDPLQLNTTYAITISGGKDLAGNSMTAFTANFKTAATSAGVSTTDATLATVQSDVKSGITKWVEAMNASDLSLFGSMLTGNFNYSFSNNQTSCDVSSPCFFDLNKDGSLSYDEFIKFIENWFNNNKKITGWSGDSTGIHMTGDVTTGTSIKVDEVAGTAAFAFTLSYLNKADANGVTTAYTNGGTINIYLTLQNINGAWYMSSISDKDNTGAINATIVAITTAAPLNAAALAQGTRSITFNWTPVTSVKSYAVVLTDNNDPTGSTGWVGIVDASKITGTTAAFDYTSVSDLDASDGKIVFIGGGLNSPFSKALTLQDGGSYTWMVIGFKTLVASSFTGTLTVEPDADVMAMSSGASFSIDGALATTTLTVTPKTSTGTALTFSDALYAWDAGSANSVTIDITPSTAASTGGKIYVYGNNYAEKAFTFVNGKAQVTIDLFTGYNWIDVTDGVNWWYASTNQTRTSYASNYFYTTAGVSYTQLIVDSVTSSYVNPTTGSLTLTTDAYGYYNLPGTSTATTVTIQGKASAGTVYIYNSTNTNSSTSSATVTNGAYTAVVDIYKDYNWISIYDGYGNWAYVNINNLGGGTTYVAPISNVTVDSTAVSAGATITTTKNTDVTIAGNLAKSGNGYWYKWSNTAYTYGTLTRNADGTFSFPILADSGYNYIDLYDANWNWYGITINNTNTTTTQPNTITTIGGDAHVATQYSYISHNAGTACSITIAGSSPASASKSIYVYLYNYNSTTGSTYDYKTITADSSGNYSFTQAIYKGTNYIDVYDANWNWQGAQVESTCATAVTTFAATVNGATWTDGWYWNSTASTVTINGTATAGKTITAYLYAGTVYSTYTTTADTSGNFSFTNMPIYTGWNYVYLTDGSNWLYPYIYTTGGSTYTLPISGVAVSNSTKDGGGGSSDSWSSWNTTASSVTITGNATVAGAGYWYHSGSYTYTSGALDITSGAFSKTIALDYGYNYISLYDANWNYYSVTIYTTGGTNAPVKTVSITNPAHGSTTSGSATISGTIATASFTPAYIYGYVYDYTNYAYTYAYWDGVTDATTIASWGYVPLTYNAGTFSFSSNINANNLTWIGIYAYDALWNSRGHYVYVNNPSGYAEYFWKPGTKATANDTKAQAHMTEFRKMMMRDKARSKTRSKAGR